MSDQDELQAIAIKLEDDGEWSCRWVGISAEMAARVLYTMADAIVDQHIEPDPRWSGKPPAR